MWDDIESKDDLVELFTDVLGCVRCPINSIKRDQKYNIPQPGWVGRNYAGIMFVGQNPGEGRTPPTEPDRIYLDALREVKDIESLNSMHDRLKEATESFVYYKSFHFNTDIENVAYINAVRCRTTGNAAPHKDVQQKCRRHFLSWVNCLKPKAVIYLGLFAEKATGDLLKRLDIEYQAISRQRSLSSDVRAKQHQAAVELIDSVLDSQY
jgi:uracil-DNA glycosylase